MMQRAIVHLDADAFFASVEQAADVRPRACFNIWTQREYGSAVTRIQKQPLRTWSGFVGVQRTRVR